MLTEKQLINLLFRLVNHTTPYGYERKLTRYLPQGGKWDEANNYIIEIGANSETLFCCHLDTIGNKYVKTKPQLKQGIIYKAKKGSCLGGDDKCGVLCLIAMIHAGISGTYIFHSGEEVGGFGAEHIVKSLDLTKFKRAIEFDRRGKTSVITHMGWEQTCSYEFAEELAINLGLGFQPDSTGSFTDVLTYSEIIPEITNISVGYESAHSSDEFIDALWLIRKLIPKLYTINWETLPTVRNPQDYFNVIPYNTY